MATLNQITDQTLGEVNSYVRNQESVTVTTNLATSDDLTITVDDASVITKGIVEIDDELIYVKKSLATSGTPNSGSLPNIPLSFLILWVEVLS